MNTEWRVFRGWTDEELQERLDKLKRAPINYPSEGPESQAGKNWRRYYSENIIGYEEPGEVLKDSTFVKVWQGIAQYKFSDPDIVEGHFNPDDDLQNRSILLEIKVMGLRYLCGVRVIATKQDSLPDRTVYGFRYDTLEGHMEIGSEWFLLTKIHKTGEIWFRISASWRPGEFPNWWSRVGFHFLSQRYQLTWHRLAYLRLRQLAGGQKNLAPIPYGIKLVHTGPEVEDSSLWVLEKPSAVEKLIKVGKADEKWNDKEEQG